MAAWWDSTHSSRRAVVTLSKTDGQQEQHHLYRQQNGFHIEFCIQTIFISSYIQLFSQSWCFVVGFALPLWLVFHFSFPVTFLLLPMTSNEMTDLISHGFRCGSSTSTKFLNTSGRRIPMFPQSSEASLVSMDWEKGNILTGNHRFSQEIWGFPVIFSLKSNPLRLDLDLFAASIPKLVILVGGLSSTPLKNDGLRLLGWWNSQYDG